MIIGILLVNFSSDKSEKMNNVIFHVTLADPDLYINGVYAEKFTIDKGQYSFRFVPNGSSPEILSIINGRKILIFLKILRLKVPHTKLEHLNILHGNTMEKKF